MLQYMYTQLLRAHNRDFGNILGRRKALQGGAGCCSMLQYVYILHMQATHQVHE